MQSGFQGTPPMHDPCFHPGALETKQRCAAQIQPAAPLSMWAGLRAAISLDRKGERHFAHSMWTQLEVTLVMEEARTSHPFPSHSWVGQGVQPWFGDGLV